MSRRMARTSGAASGLLSPTQLGFNTWHDARVTASGASWTDKLSGLAFTQGTAGNRPTVSTIGPGSHPALLFDGVDDYLASATPWSIGNGAAYTMLAVVQTALPSAGTQGIAVVNGSAERAGLGVAFAAGSYYALDKDDNVATEVFDAAPVVIGSTMTAARSLTVWRSGYALKTVACAAWGGTAPSAAVIGNVPGFSLYFSGRIAHIAVRYGTPLTATQMASVSGYLMSLINQ